MRQGAHAATEIARVLRGKPTRPTRIASLGAIAGIGCRTGVAKRMGVRISGFAAWWLDRTVCLLKMPGLARKLRLAVDWTMDLLFPRDYVQLSVRLRRTNQDADD
jgi:NADH dehydrogenase